MPVPWTKPEVSSHPMGDWSLPQATAWRQTAVDSDSDGDDDDYLRTADLAAPTLAAWLQDAGKLTSLHLAAAVGGGLPPTTWLGLSTRAETTKAALRSLQQDTQDMGSLLDTWGWFRAPKATTPPCPSPTGLHLVDAAGDADALLIPTGGWPTPTLPSVLQSLAMAPLRLTLHLSITPAVADANLIHQVEQAARRAVAHDQHAQPWEEPSHLTERTLNLHGRVTASIISLQIDGIPPTHRALRTWISRALSYDLGGDLVFSDQPQPLRLHGSRTQRLLEIATLRADAPSTGPAPGGRLDEIPF
ncbi:MAG: hypothetical protein GXP62_00020 [Oligoflexia bacterium]|nr:hypothetical protein [Oligoflexia bacterium]